MTEISSSLVHKFRIIWEEKILNLNLKKSHEIVKSPYIKKFGLDLKKPPDILKQPSKNQF